MYKCLDCGTEFDTIEGYVEHSYMRVKESIDALREAVGAIATILKEVGRELIEMEQKAKCGPIPQAALTITNICTSTGKSPGEVTCLLHETMRKLRELELL